MELLKNKSFIKRFYLVSFFMITNSLLFGFIFRMIGLNFWRQIIWIIGLGVFYKYIYNKNVSTIIDKYYTYSISVLLFFIPLTMFIEQYSIVRILFSSVNYIYGFAFIAMPFFFRENPIYLFKFFAYLGVFISVGLVIDSITPVFTVLQIDESLVSRAEERATFLTENPTTLGTFYNFLLINVLYLVYLSKSNFNKIKYFLLSLLFIPGAIVTGSRQVLLVLIFSFLVMILMLWNQNAKYKIILLLTVLIFSIPIANFTIDLIANSENEITQERFSKETIEDDNRSELWAEGLDQLSIYNIDHWFYGYGLGATNNKNIEPNEYVHTHYENTFFASFAELGYFSMAIFLFPIFYVMKQLVNQRKTMFFGYVLSSILGYTILSYISPNGAAPQSQMVLFITLGMLLNKNYYYIKN